MPYGRRSARTVPLPKDWHKIRARILARDEHACRWPVSANGVLCGQRATDVDHINDPDDHSDGNLQALCGSHHRRKSAGQGARAMHARRTPRRRPEEQHPGIL